MRVGIVGLGFGRFHAAALARLPSVEVAAICQCHEPEPPLETFAEHYAANGYRSVEDMLASERLDLVCICTRPSQHVAAVQAVAEAGAAMLIEKPAGGSVSDARRICEAVRASRVWAAVNFEMRWLPPVQRLRALLSDGYLGEPLLMELSYITDALPAESWVWQPEEGGTPLWENTCHAYDLARYLLGEVDVCQSTTANLFGAGSPAPDCAIVTMKTASGALVNIVGGAMGIQERKCQCDWSYAGQRGTRPSRGASIRSQRLLTLAPAAKLSSSTTRIMCTTANLTRSRLHRWSYRVLSA